MLGKPLDRGVHSVGALDEAAGGSGRARVRVRLSPESRSLIVYRDIRVALACRATGGAYDACPSDNAFGHRCRFPLVAACSYLRGVP